MTIIDRDILYSLPALKMTDEAVLSNDESTLYINLSHAQVYDGFL